MVERIQVCEDYDEDILIWSLTLDGEYSVQSAYRMLVAEENLTMSSSSSPTDSGLVWKKIWKI